jgi:4-carboxymuconolactone decarboxylase
MSRIPLTTLDQQPQPIRQFMARRGELNLFRLLANAPAVFVGWAQMVDEMLDSPTFTARMRELIVRWRTWRRGNRPDGHVDEPPRWL